MNPELLKKCLSGNATNSEWEIYLKWLEGGDPEHGIDELVANEQDIKDRILNKVIADDKRLNLQRRIKISALNTGIAACLLCVLYCSTVFHSHYKLRHDQVFRYNETDSDLKNNFNGIVVQLAKNSAVRLNQRTNTSIYLDFMGSVMLSNKSTRDQNITIKQHKNSLKNLCLRKGHCYLLSYLNFKSEEIILVDKQSMIDMPPALAMNMQKQFNL